MNESLEALFRKSIYGECNLFGLIIVYLSLLIEWHMFKIIAWIVFFYLLFRVLRAVLVPLLGLNRKMHNPYQQQPFGQNYEQRNEGSTTYHKSQTNSTTRKNNDDDGEYIDYKEIKD